MLRQPGTGPLAGHPDLPAPTMILHAGQHGAIHGVIRGSSTLLQELMKILPACPWRASQTSAYPEAIRVDGIRVIVSATGAPGLNLGRQDVAAVLQPHHVLGGILEAGHGALPLR